MNRESSTIYLDPPTLKTHTEKERGDLIYLIKIEKS